MLALRRALRIGQASLLWQAIPRRSEWAYEPWTFITRQFSAGKQKYASSRIGHNFSAADLKPPDPILEVENTILARARRYGIYDINRLHEESSLGQMGYVSSRLVDQPAARGDFELWCILLDFQRLRFGDEGVKVIYRGLRNRCGKDFPFYGPDADYLWDTFLTTATRDLAFLRSLCHFEIRSGAPRDEFMVDIVGRLLESPNPAWARATTWALRGKHQVYRADILHFFLCACRSESSDALENFRLVYKSLSRSNLYGDIIAHLLRLDRIVDAFGMHKYLISIGDLPQNFESLIPLIRQIARKGADLNSFLAELSCTGASFDAQARRLYDLERTRIVGFSKDNLNIVASSTFGRHKRTMTDEFAARGFATSSLPFELVLNGLRLLGLTSIGPLSVRQIALAARGPKELSQRFSRLQEVGVDTGSSNYVRTVKRLAYHNQTALLAAVLETDQHADVFDDVILQKQLLQNYYSSGDWSQINRTLAILNEGETDRRAEESSSNLLLQSALSLRDWVGVNRIASEMRRENKAICIETVQAIRGILQPRDVKLGRGSKRQIEDISIVVPLLQDALKLGTYFGPEVWREIIRRLGMLGRWDDLQKIILWVASWYHNNTCLTPGYLAGTRPRKGLQQLFNPRQQAAIIAWAFIFQTKSYDIQMSSIAKSAHEPTTEVPWVRGIKLLHSLQKYGVSVYHGAVQSALIHRLRILFSVEGSSKLLRNRRLRQSNSIALIRYLKSFYQAWMKPLGSGEEQHLIRSILRGRRIRPRDAIFLQLSMKWELRQQQKTATAQRWRQRQGRARVMEVSRNTPTATEDSEKVVEYRDLFNASWGEYERQYGRG